MSGHNHQSCGSHGSGNILRWSLAGTVLFVVVQFAAGMQSGSLALLSDAGHNLTDAFALGLALFGVYLQAKPADAQRTYGYHRGGVLAALLNALLLMVLSGYIFYQAWFRLQSPHAVEERTMIVVAGLGILLNGAILLALRKFERDVNIRAASLHMLGDALGSVAIIVGAVAIYYTRWYWIDPAISVVIGALIVWSGIDVIRESLNILLEGTPRGLDLAHVQDTMCSVPGVTDVHDVHLWSLGSATHALSCHALIEDMPPSESQRILDSLTCLLAERFGIRHTTIQFEHQHCPVSMNGCSMGEVAHRH